MSYNKKAEAERHLKTHSVTSDEDRAAVDLLGTFLRSRGKINTNFSKEDRWPNTDGIFEFVSNPNVSRRPNQNFSVQIKGTRCYDENNGVIKYSLRSLAFPAYIYSKVTLDPGILFVVLNPDDRGSERIFWKYMSVDFVNSIDFTKDSATIRFTSDEEIKNTDESIEVFCDKLEKIINHHSFISQLDDLYYSEKDIEKIIKSCDEQITESIDRMEICNDTRDNISKRILTRLEDLCTATLIFNLLKTGFKNVNIRLAWERSMLNIETNYLGIFFRGLKYLGRRTPDDGQSERLMLKYYDFLWQIRKNFKEQYGLSILHNLENFPLNKEDPIEQQYYESIAKAVDSISLTSNQLRTSRYYVQKKVPFFIGKERYYELTLQLAGIYSTKYNRITAYTKINITTEYSVQIGYDEANIDLWGVLSKIKVITNWKVSIEPTCLNMLAKSLRINTKINSKYGEYSALMHFLTETGMSLLDLIDLQEIRFSDIIDGIYENSNTSYFKDVLLQIREKYSAKSELQGRNTIRYLLINLREEDLESVLPNTFTKNCLSAELYLSSRCFPFEKNPFISNLPGIRSSESGNIQKIIKVAGHKKLDVSKPYLFLKNSIKQTGEIYFQIDLNQLDNNTICKYNSYLDSWEQTHGYRINIENNFASIDSYEKSTIFILETLLELSSKGNKGQKELNQFFLQHYTGITDYLKAQAIQNAFVNSKVLLIYGAAGTGKTTLMNYVSDLMSNRRKLFLTKTHTALQNLKRRIDNPGTNSDFISFDSFTKKVTLPDYDIIFVDECSTIDNRAMQEFLKKIGPNTFLVLAGDVYQIESIEFGNWFFYAKDIIKTFGSNIELLSTWRTHDRDLINLWDEVRNKNPLIIEKLVIDGPFSENIGSNILTAHEKDEVILCLNYDGKFGLNNMNNFFQNANPSLKSVSWQEWIYKVGDPILFNNSKRFPILYNNLKGRIVDVEKAEKYISFTIDVDIIITEIDCKNAGLNFIDVIGNTTRINFAVNKYEDGDTNDVDELSRINSVVPFQLAYAVSIHKAQGLEYDSVKVIIPNNNSEKITHGVFYTAITRAKKKLKIYWSSETMNKIVNSFSDNQAKMKSLDIIKSKLQLE